MPIITQNYQSPLSSNHKAPPYVFPPISLPFPSSSESPLKQNIFQQQKIILSRQDMQGSNDGPRTPLRGEEDKQVAETGFKNDPAESQLREEQSDDQAETEDLLRQLEHYETEIARNQQRLREIAEEKLRHDDTSEEYARLEDERRTLRKELVDYDYDHKKAFKRYRQLKEEAERRQAEERNRKIEEEIRTIQREREQAALERSRRLEEQLNEIHESSKKRREEIERLYQKEETTREQPKQEAPQEGEAPAQGEKSAEEKLAEAKFNERVREIELELASQRLRRSRQIELEAELIRIRSYQPLDWWSLYGSTYYPLYPRYPVYPLYRPLYDPLFYPRLYPYGYPIYPRYPFI